MDYGAMFYGSTYRTHLQKLERVQNKALRIITGAFCSTPLNALMAESGEPPPHTRHTLLVDRSLVGTNSKDPDMYSQIRALAIKNLTTPYWREKNHLPCYATVSAMNLHGLRVHQLPFNSNHCMKFLNPEFPLSNLPK